MAIIEIHIAVKDKSPSIANFTEVKKKQGDIVNVQPQYHDIGRKELDAYFTIPVNIPIAIDFPKLKSKLLQEYFENGAELGTDFRPINHKTDGVSKTTYPDNIYMWDTKLNTPILEPELLSKNRYMIDVDLLGDIDVDLFENENIIYQPFLKEERLINLKCFRSGYYETEYKNGRYRIRRIKKNTRKIYEEEINGQIIRYIRPKEPSIIVLTPDEPWYEIFCETPTVAKNDEKIFEWGLTKNIVRDKHTNDWLSVDKIGIK